MKQTRLTKPKALENMKQQHCQFLELLMTKYGYQRNTNIRMLSRKREPSFINIFTNYCFEENFLHDHKGHVNKFKFAVNAKQPRTTFEFAGLRTFQAFSVAENSRSVYITHTQHTWNMHGGIDVHCILLWVYHIIELQNKIYIER